MKQRTDEWYLIRKGRFTSSDIISICKSGKTFETEVYSKSYETFIPDDIYLDECLNQYKSKALSWGIEWEDTARQEYERRTGREVTEVGFVEYGKHTGGSPDGLVLRDRGQIEIKCPYVGANHFKYSRMEVAEDLLSVSDDGKKYYYQMQANILFNQSNYSDFISFDPRVRPDFQMRIIRCYPNDKVLKIIEESIPKAINLKEQIIIDIINNSTSNKKIKEIFNSK